MVVPDNAIDIGVFPHHEAQYVVEGAVLHHQNHDVFNFWICAHESLPRGLAIIGECEGIFVAASGTTAASLKRSLLRGSPRPDRTGRLLYRRDPPSASAA